MEKEYLEPAKFTIENLIAENDLVTAVGKISMKDKDGKAVVCILIVMSGSFTKVKWPN